MQAQQQLQQADTSTTSALKSKARELVDEFIDDEGDREIVENLVNDLADRLTESQVADSIVGLTLDYVQKLYHSRA